MRLGVLVGHNGVEAKVGSDLLRRLRRRCWSSRQPILPRLGAGASHLSPRDFFDSLVPVYFYSAFKEEQP